MRKTLVILLLAGLSIANPAAAQKHHGAHLRIGLTLMQPRWEVWMSGPDSVRVWGPEVVPAKKYFDMRALLGLNAGLRLAKWKVTAGIALYPYGEPGVVPFRCFSGWELFVRYTIWERKRLTLYAVSSLARFSPLDETGWPNGYCFCDPFFLPGLGAGVNASIFRTEIKLHKWPGLVVGEAAEPAPEYPQHRWNFIPKPLRLKYAVSFLLGIEFTLFKF